MKQFLYFSYRLFDLKIIILSVFILFPFSIHPQNPEWINYTYNEDILAFAQEGRYLWVGTGGGLLCLEKDSGDIIYFNRSNSKIPDNSVNSIVVDNGGNKWIGTLGGLAKFKGVDWTVYNSINSGLLNNYVYSFAIDHEGNKWVGTSGCGLTMYDGENWITFSKLNSGLPSNLIRAIAIDSEGKKWIGTQGGGLAIFDGITWIVYDVNNSQLTDNDVECLAFDSKGNIWIGTFYRGLAVFREGGVSLDVIEPLPDIFFLEQNYPNPFNYTTQIHYQLFKAAHVRLNVYNLLGEKVVTLVDEFQPAEHYNIQFQPNGIASSIYFCQLRANDFIETKRMLFIK